MISFELLIANQSHTNFHYTYRKAIKLYLLLKFFPKFVRLPNCKCLYSLAHYYNYLIHIQSCGAKPTTLKKGPGKTLCKKHGTTGMQVVPIKLFNLKLIENSDLLNIMLIYGYFNNQFDYWCNTRKYSLKTLSL